MQTMLTLDQVKKLLHKDNLKARKSSLVDVAQAAGISYFTLGKLMNESGRDPLYSTVKALSDHLQSWN